MSSGSPRLQRWPQYCCAYETACERPRDDKAMASAERVPSQFQALDKKTPRVNSGCRLIPFSLTHREAFAVPSSAVPLPAFSAPAFAASVPGAWLAAPASTPPEEACAAPDAGSVEESAAAQQVRSGSVAAVEQDDSSQAGSAESVPAASRDDLVPADSLASSFPADLFPDDLFPDDRSVVRTLVEPGDCPFDSSVRSALARRRADPVARRLAGFQVGCPCGSRSALPISPEELASPWGAWLRHWPDASFALRSSPAVVPDALPTPAAVSRKAPGAEAASSSPPPAGSRPPVAAQPHDWPSQHLRPARYFVSEPPQPAH